MKHRGLLSGYLEYVSLYCRYRIYSVLFSKQNTLNVVGKFIPPKTVLNFSKHIDVIIFIDILIMTLQIWNPDLIHPTSTQPVVIPSSEHVSVIATSMSPVPQPPEADALLSPITFYTPVPTPSSNTTFVNTPDDHTVPGPKELVPQVDDKFTNHINIPTLIQSHTPILFTQSFPLDGSANSSPLIHSNITNINTPMSIINDDSDSGPLVLNLNQSPCLLDLKSAHEARSPLGESRFDILVEAARRGRLIGSYTGIFTVRVNVSVVIICHYFLFLVMGSRLAHRVNRNGRVALST